ncbi:alkaline phosphatase family protein [Streptomyces sp. NPDC057555]|uniref:alkaline phosphatase family protein n=1 Tax=Streptomyces sp. NPDC057555 TaxID=3346166 RepID=UPI00369026FF
MKQAGAQQLTVNGRDYAWPARPVVVVCIDGSEDAYHERAVADGRMPFLEGMLRRGSDLRADCTMPSFTNPNNLSIATGVPPSVTPCSTATSRGWTRSARCWWSPPTTG